MRLPHPLDQRVRYRLILNALPAPPARVLEVGVGSGWLIKELSRQGYEVRGCDLDLGSWTELDMQQYHVSLASENSHLNYESNFFDVVISCDVLEHVQPNNRDMFIRELIRVTRPGGEVLLTAFFRWTYSLGLWGGALIAIRHGLPRWYKEHLEIPTPNECETLELISQECENIKITRYQRALNILTCIAQGISGPFGVINRFANLFSYVVPAIDVLGTPTSTMFCATKRARGARQDLIR